MRTLLALAAVILTAASASAGEVRTFIIYGMGGVVTSAGMNALIEPLKKFGPVSVHNWQDTNAILLALRTEKRPVAIAGFSLGADDIGWIGQYAPRQIELAIAYDPSKGSPLVDRATLTQRAPNVKRLVQFWHPNAWIYGGAKYVGANVFTYKINMPHLAVAYCDPCHKITINEVAKLAGE